MILLFLLPFYDRGPERRPERRPIATTAGIFTIAAMAYLTYLGAAAGAADRRSTSPRPPRIKARARRCSPSTRRASRSWPSRAAWPATRSARTATAAPARALTEIAARLPAQAIERTLINPTAPMPSLQRLQKDAPEKFKAW